MRKLSDGPDTPSVDTLDFGPNDYLIHAAFYEQDRPLGFCGWTTTNDRAFMRVEINGAH
jgi:hypothetical protein